MLLSQDIQTEVNLSNKCYYCNLGFREGIEILEASKVKKISLYIYTQWIFNPIVKIR